MPSKKPTTALVLAGGGLTGAGYEIGALRAIDDLLIDRSVNDFDIYVGTSAGALVSSYIASGVRPETMLQTINGSHEGAHSIRRRHLFSLNWLDYLAWGAKLPVKLVNAWTQYLLNINESTLFDLLASLSESLPSGMYNSLGLAKFISQSFAEQGISDEFRDRPHKLFIIATDLDTGERAIFGQGYRDVLVSQAVAASSAMPILYKPVRINGHDYIDGGTRGNASIDLAIEQGARLVVVINPLVPFDNPLIGDGKGIPQKKNRNRHLSDQGVQTVSSQALRILLHSGVHYHIKQSRRAHPEVDIILIEPSPTDHEMFSYNIMRYSALLTMGRHGFESVARNLVKDYSYYKDIMFRQNVPITLRYVTEEMEDIEKSNYDPQVIQCVLEARTPYCHARRKNTPLCELDRALAELEYAIERISS